MANDLFPAFLKINYTSLYAPHTMTIPTTPYNSTTDIWEDHNGDPGKAVNTGVIELVDLLKVLMPASTTFTDFTVFTKASVSDPALPVFSGVLGVAGTSVVTGNFKATQWTWTWRTDEFGLSKLVLLDLANANSFEKYVSLTGITSFQDLDSYWRGGLNFIAGRDGGKPATFLQIAITLNEKLRKAYRMN